MAAEWDAKVTDVVVETTWAGHRSDKYRNDNRFS